MSADAQFRAFIDRILRCREAEDEAKEDTKAVYAELKAECYDKTIVGKLIAELRSREKNSAKVDEQETLLELYRDAYQRASGTPVATHMHTRATPIPSQDGKTESEGLASAPVTEPSVQQQGSSHEHSGQHVGLAHHQQCDAARVSRPLGRGEGVDEVDQGQGPGASGDDRNGGTVARIVDRENKDGRGRHVGGEARHEVVPEQARVSSTALAADPAKPLPLGSWVGHPFNDTGPHVFSDQEPS